MREFIIIVAVAVPCILLVVWLLFNKREKERTAELERLAGEMGLDFQAEDVEAGEAEAEAEAEQFRLFHRGRGRTKRNLLRGGIEGAEVAIFDYRYVVGSGKNRRVYHQTVLGFRAAELNLPRFEVRPEGVFHKIGQFFGYQDIDFPTHRAFSDRFLLRGEDEGRIRAFFTPSLLELFEAHPGISVEGGGDGLIVYRNRKRSDPGEVRSFLKEGFRFLEVMKRNSENS